MVKVAAVRYWVSVSDVFFVSVGRALALWLSEPCPAEQKAPGYRISKKMGPLMDISWKHVGATGEFDTASRFEVRGHILHALGGRCHAQRRESERKHRTF